VVADLATSVEAFVESLKVLLAHVKWTPGELGVHMGVSRQWAYKLVTNRRQGSTLSSMDAVCAAFLKADPPLIITPAEILDPEKIRGKLGVTSPDRAPAQHSSNTSPVSLESVHASKLLAQIDRLESERARLTSTLFDIHTALDRHFKRPRNAGRAASAAQKPPRSGGRRR
jgi:DNA-binding Xre family transcriptional regulator